MRFSTSSLERIVVLLTALALAACVPRDAAPRLEVDKVVHDGGVLRVALRYRPSRTQLQALDEGVPLGLVIRVAGAVPGPLEFRMSMRYFPLSRRYQLHVAGGEEASFALRGYLFAALESLRLPLPRGACDAGTRCRVEVRQDYAALPGALRLPALLRDAWRVTPATADVAEPAA